MIDRLTAIVARRDARQLRALLLSLVLALVVLTVSASPASAAVRFSVKASWADSTLHPGGTGMFTIYSRNLGTDPSAGVITLVDHLPAGVRMTGYDVIAPGVDQKPWFCFGTDTVTCKNTGSTQALGTAGTMGNFLPTLYIYVSIDPNASGTRTNTAIISGGGAAIPATDVDPVAFADTSPGFGVLPSSFEGDVFDGGFPDGSPQRQAGSHPHELRVNFDFNQGYNLGTNPNEDLGIPYSESIGRVRTVDVTLPRGLIGNPESTPKCTPLDFTNQGADNLLSTGCPSDTQVGYLGLDVSDGGTNHGNGPFAPNFLNRVAIYNLVPPKGVAADLGFQAGGMVVGHIYANLDPSRNYAIRSTSPFVSDFLPVRSAQVTIWGVPGDPAHDVFRAHAPDGYTNDGTPIVNGDAFGASFGAPIRPFLTLPMDCGVDNGPFHIRVDSWNNPEQFGPTLDAAGRLNVSGCADRRIRFNPAVSLQPTTHDAGQPTGLDVHLQVPQRDQTVDDYNKLYAPNGSLHGIDTPPAKKVVVTLPLGMTISPSAAQGLGSCTLAQIGFELKEGRYVPNNEPVRCPDSSQYGTLTLHTPILPENAPMKGYIYVARQNENPFNNFLSMYFVIEEPERGILVKIPGKIDLNPVTGQITTTFDDLPQFPVSDMQLSFKSGVRSALVNPSTCGSKTITATFYSWAAPDTPVSSDSSYEITHKADGSPCVDSLADRPFRPQMTAGTLSPNAGSYSPFLFRMTRSDDDQEISQIGTGLPPGLTAKLAGITECPEAGIAQAVSRVGAGDGALEQADPSCPNSSYFGSTQVGAGVGVPLIYLPGKIYLAGPYHGAPLSLVVITPVVAGPYDLGVIAVRTSLNLDPQTTAASVTSDPFPQIYQGIPVRIRDIRLKIDRPETTKNPTSCAPMQITAHLTGTGGDVNTTADDTGADLSEPFQATNCQNLGFKPKLSFKLKGGTDRGDHPALSATLATRPGDANMSRVAVTLPHSEFLDQSHINTICTRPQFAAEECPAGSIYGRAKAWTPLLDQPLEGNVYLRSSNHSLPDLVMALRGQVEVDVVGRIDSVNGGLRTTFETIPDQPVSKFTLQMEGGGKGLLQNSTDLCKAKNLSNALIVAQNSKTLSDDAPLQTGCGKAQRHRRHRLRHQRSLNSARRAG